MHFDLIQSLSLCGDPLIPNDDRAGSTAGRAWVIDGATDLGSPGLLGEQGGAAWLAMTADAAFATADAPTLAEACTQVCERVETRYAAEARRMPAGPWELPRASFAAIQIAGHRIDLAWASDCSVLHATADGTAWRTPAPSRARESAQAAALGPGIGAVKLGTEAVLQDRRQSRSRPGQRVLSIDAAATLAILGHARFDIAVGDELLLMSDGMVALVDAYGRHDADSLFAAVRAHGLAALGTELRDIERDDAACLRFPRFKVSDDATALWLRIGG
ncbi:MULTISPECIES: hypothetical protein [unclassified Sphingomonas]|uniref:hypothetical protein n=1 Tax=unclassified Sphingomonas TaxID=196159 RepID=UPI0006F277F8|nr:MULTISPECIES: hypothetical protein [unclassified Sphingomonas]KQM57177.1 hypothetical protein ASE65_12650 [Sphingomonas sp. Leaf16]KQN10352.1 hypothetical protein ASE81_12695 [Sphingomonas sp. Leaf29]KQN18284.1 hypothetical protein ASE83_12625 [Sphingomonas sp. Leaf32]